MREIKFRGLSHHNEWVYGNLCTHYEGEPQAVYIIDKDCLYHKVEPESIGQFTGFVDKNRVEIYDGADIYWPTIMGEVYGKISWEQHAGAFWLKWEQHGKRYKEMAANFSDGEIYMIDYFEVKSKEEIF